MDWSDGERITLPSGIDIQHFNYKHNGMKVLICEMHTAPICGYMRVVNAGARDEDSICGKGIAHFIEHMAFRIKGGEYWELERNGHEDNACTNETSTRFFDFGNSDHIERVISLDSRRFLTAEVPSNGIPIEMKAVLNEEERDSSASGTLFRHAQAVSHLFSRFHYPTIGMRHDIENTTAEDMKKFRETFYKLNNSTFVVVGHVNTKNILQHFEKAYGHIRDEPVVKKTYPSEPLQQGKRVVNINMPTDCAMSCITFVSPPSNTRESVALSVLKYIIANGDSGRRNEVTKKHLMYNLGVYAPRNVDAYIFCLHGSFPRHDTQTVEKGESGVFHMLHSIRTNVTMEEIEVAKKTLHTEWAVLPFKTIHSSLMALGEAIDLGNWKDISHRVETLKDINVKDIQKVIADYLTYDKSTSVRIYPTSKVAKAPTTRPMSTTDVTPARFSGDTTLQWSCQSSVDIKGNARLQLIETSGRDVVWNVSLPYDNSNRHVANISLGLVGKHCLFEGKRLDTAGITAMMASLNMDMEKDVGENMVHFTFIFRDMNCLTQGLKFASYGILQQSEFNSSDLNYYRNQTSAEIASLKSSQMYTTKRELVHMMFKNTKYDESIDSKMAKHRNVSMTEVKHFYKNVVGENKAWYSTLAYPQTEEIKDLNAVLSTSKTARRLSESPVKDNVWTVLDKKCDFKKVDLSGFKSSTVFVGQTTSLDMYDKKNIALSLGVQALGGGMTGRLMSILRCKDGEKNGVYGVYASTYSQLHAPTYVVINATFTPSLEHHGLRELKYELNRWNTKFISEEELENSKRELLGKRALDMDDFNVVTDIYHSHLLNNRDPTQEWNSYKSTVESVTLEEVQGAIQLLDPAKWVSVSTGPASFWDEDTDEVA